MNVTAPPMEPFEVSDPLSVQTNVTFLQETIAELEEFGASRALIEEMRRRLKRWQDRLGELGVK